ncbi:phosphotransferase enzyme family protein [Blastomyces gilchristii SLH14081]|uniref:Phosphotransferase enzyme family protein n=1 Tax=Blastomyces gilchristii (strain SLH14081) TaxID=559298 RepID=A0A179UKC3_BLAGS|nr:phosphotransferase enzyme family protein [Blastomyces gilchristii SLH14081]OAT08340.1 phosphotransferase enzyme family protein [Blastomyces gilchristii SLH14081]
MLPFYTDWSASLNFFLGANTALFITALPIVYSVGSRYFRGRNQTLPTPSSPAPLSPTPSLPIKLPYFAPDIPHPLTENTEIENATLLVKHNGYKVVQVGTEFVVKFGAASQVDLLEGVNMAFVQQATKVKIPRVYALYNDPESLTNYIIMEFIEGNSLDTQWAHFTNCQKCEVATTLRQYFDELRNLPSPGFFATLNEALALKYIGESEHRTTYNTDFYRRSLSHVFRGHVPKFTHGDFQRKNIMIKQLPNNANNSKYEVTIIDWETAGWYPSY